MKRKLLMKSSLRPFEEEDMEQLNVADLASRCTSAGAALLSDDSVDKRRGAGLVSRARYPLALALRLRVLQIVCGISTMVMGGVALIEERRRFNMGLGLPAGGVTVVAAAVSIHTSRGWSGGGGGAAGAAVWGGVTCLLAALMVLCCRTIAQPLGDTQLDDASDLDSPPSARDLTVIAWVQLLLSLSTLVSAAACLRIDQLT